MIPPRPRETVILADDFDSLVAWYRDVLGLSVAQLFDDGNRYANLESPTGLRLGIAPAKEMGVEPGDRARATVLLQIEVDDVRAFFAHIEAHGGGIAFGPDFNAKDGFWFGDITDPEGNHIWVVDPNCP